jgi:hypothetical protein
VRLVTPPFRDERDAGSCSPSPTAQRLRAGVRIAGVFNARDPIAHRRTGGSRAVGGRPGEHAGVVAPTRIGL